MSQPSPSNASDGAETGPAGEGEPVDAESEPAQATDAEVDAGLEVVAGATEDARALYLDGDETGELISSLSSDTARSILVALDDRPATASELADHVDTTVQNVRHHLGNLREVDLVRVADTRYSSKGREMDVYAPVERPLVVVVGSRDEGRLEEEPEPEGFVDSLSRFVGAVVGLALTSLLVQWLAVSRSGAGDGVVRLSDALGGGAGPVVAPPGLLFFAGGALVLAAASGWRYWRRNHA